MSKILSAILDPRGWVKPETAAGFQALAPDATLPWHTGEELEREAEMIFDANGRHIATVDEWKHLPENEAVSIARMIVIAVNTCGGFKLETVSTAAGEG